MTRNFPSWFWNDSRFRACTHKSRSFGNRWGLMFTSPRKRPNSRHLDRSALGLGRVKTFSCKRSELEEVATRAVFPDFDYALIAAISG
jgi:hypothetical protein